MGCMGDVPLVCFPFAGAGASFFRPWSARLAGQFDVIAVQLPGREKRIGDPPHTEVSAAIGEALPELSRSLGSRRDVVVFGHSLGAVLAYELARAASREAGFQVQRLVVSGSPAPSHQRARRATGLSDDQFLQRVSDFAGYSHPVLQDPEMRELLLPALRADVEMHEGYLPGPLDVLAASITCLRGRDDALVSLADSARWQEVTGQPLDLVEVAGGHMYLVDQPERVFEVLHSVRAVAA
jgi:surfactin synthase thioesterase subunit